VQESQSRGLGVATPSDFGLWGVAGWVVKYYYNLIMYRKYVRKWWLLKRNRKMCPEVAVNGQFLPGKSKLFLNCLKIEIFQKFAWKSRNSSKICLEKSKFFKNLPAWIKSKFFVKLSEKNRNFSEIWLEKSKIFWPVSQWRFYIGARGAKPQITKKEGFSPQIPRVVHNFFARFVTLT